MKERTAWPFG